MEEFKFHIENGKLANGTFPMGLDSLCAVVDVYGGLMKYGEEDRIKEYYMKLLGMYNSSKNKIVKEMNLFGLPDLEKPELLFIKFNDLELPLEYKVDFMNYMIEVSTNGKKIQELLEGEPKELMAFLDGLKEE